MNRREQLHEMHLALEGAVDQLGAAHRVAVAGQHQIVGLDARLEQVFAELAALRNLVREELMRELAKPTGKLPTIRVKKD